MHDKNKIITMSKMAVYDKRGFEKDARSSQYFRHDYIYKRNMYMRFFLGIGCLILAFFYVMYLLGVEDSDIFALDFGAEALRLLFFALLIMVAYSFIGTIIYTREFLKSQRRINAYFSLMKALEGETEVDTLYEPEDEGTEVDEKFEPYRPIGRPAEEDMAEEFEPYRPIGDDHAYRHRGGAETPQPLEDDTNDNA
ncbi:MAG: hypothetical protein FWC93_01230 [Defluviitaleaceae bacterium]|nr:hypothetical protein [Defluviitaleaceae bacterium]